MLTQASSTLIVLGIGFVLGLKHALDPDHIVAVTTFVGTERKFRQACRVGLLWGLGHTVALSIFGILVVGLKIPISKWLADRLELAVGVMLIALGAHLIAAVHTHWHEWHQHSHTITTGVRPMLVGVVHGTAGSAALTLLVLSTISSPANGLLFILVFGIGSMIGMLLVSMLLAMPLLFAAAHYRSRLRPIQLSTGVLSCAFGLYIATTMWLALK
jgi:hypothetical protein